jgi:hypothetical protein
MIRQRSRPPQGWRLGWRDEAKRELAQQPQLARHRFGLRCAVHFTRQQHAPGDNEQLARKGNHRFLVPMSPLLAAVKLPERSGIVVGQYVGRFHQEGAEQRTPIFADPPSTVLISGLQNRGIEPDISGDLARPGETLWRPENGPDGRGGDNAHPGDRQQQRDGRDVSHTRGDLRFDPPQFRLDSCPLAHSAFQDEAIHGGQRGGDLRREPLGHVHVVGDEMAVARQHGLGLVAEALSGADQPIPIGQEPTDLAHGLRGHPHCRDCPDRQHLRETGRVDAIGVPARAQPLQFQGIGEQNLSRVWRKAVIDFEGTAGDLERDAALRPELRDQLGPTLRRGREPEMPLTMLRRCVRAPFAPVYIPVMQI